MNIALASGRLGCLDTHKGVAYHAPASCKVSRNRHATSRYPCGEPTTSYDLQVNYKLRDWLFARQRYWGEPFPIVFPEGSEARIIPLWNPGEAD